MSSPKNLEFAVAVSALFVSSLCMSGKGITRMCSVTSSNRRAMDSTFLEWYEEPLFGSDSWFPTLSLPHLFTQPPTPPFSFEFSIEFKPSRSWIQTTHNQYSSPILITSTHHPYSYSYRYKMHPSTIGTAILAAFGAVGAVPSAGPQIGEPVISPTLPQHDQDQALAIAVNTTQSAPELTYLFSATLDLDPVLQSFPIPGGVREGKFSTLS